MNPSSSKIEIDPAICNGKPVIRGTRIAVETVLDFLSAGDSVDDILVGYPNLSREDIFACLDYARRLGAAPFTVRVFAFYLDDHKIGNRMLFGGNLLRQPVFVQLRKDNPNAFRVVGETPSTLDSRLSTSSPSLPGADEIMHTALFLGTYPGLSRTQLDYEIAVIRDFVAEKSGRPTKN